MRYSLSFILLVTFVTLTMGAEPVIVEQCIKEVPERQYLMHEHVLKAPSEIPTVIRNHVVPMYEAIKQSDKITRQGPHTNFYKDMGDKTKPSILMVAAPIESTDIKELAGYPVKTVPASRYLSVLVYGPQPEKAWGKVIALGRDAGHELTGLDVEVVLAQDKKGVETLTELRLGIR